MFQKLTQKLNDKPKFSVITLAVFAIAFVLVGSYFIYQSLASQEAEIAADKETKKIETLTEHLKADSAAYKSTMPTEQKPKLEDIKKTAQERKQEMKRLATADPDTFLVNAIRKEEKEALVEDVKAYVEDQVTVTGKYTGEKVTVGSKQYNLKHNKKSPLFINPNSTTEFYGYAFDNDLIIPGIKNIGYKPNVIYNTGKTPSSNIKFAGQSVVGSVTGTSTTTDSGGGKVIVGVPGYTWRDGCAPTAVGMVIGFYDGQGYDNLVPGSATTQDGYNITDPVSQMIASHAVNGAPGHYEDYSLPKETTYTILPDKSMPPAGDEHVSNSVADFMGTAWSSYNLHYGESAAGDEPNGFNLYVKSKYPNINPSSTTKGIDTGATGLSETYYT